MKPKKKRIAIVTMDEQILQFYASQLGALFGEYAEIDLYCTQNGSANHIGKADVYAVSTCAFQDNDDAGRYLSTNADTVLLRMTITRESFDRLGALPYGTRAMMVNLSLPMAIETMVLLNQLGIKNIDFTPVYPGMEKVPELDLAITPSEQRFVPARAKQVIDIGHRVIDANTMIEIALKLHCEELMEDRKFLSYLDSIVSDNYSFSELFGKSLRLESQFSMLLSILDIGLIGVDALGRITAFNRKAEYVLNLKSSDIIGFPAREVLPFLPFEDCVSGGFAPLQRLVRANGVAISVTMTPVTHAGQYIGAFAVAERFDDGEQKQHLLRRQLMNQGYVTKYTFDNILGNSASLSNAVRIARKMAGTGSSILISGESGTGKELFAHAIHNASTRRENPFVAINCAAIPDSLFESELFGYEEGAFTGAKKGGKPGLFELAHRGTLFLDEIEGVSASLQVKLLRAIQEKEVLRVGGHRIISMDVRIIAATNENLADMVKNGTFRKDLYYRLNTLPLLLPPLRQRQDDILPLLDAMRRELGGEFHLSNEAQRILLRHPWDGNIRELRNCVEYLIYTGEGEIGADDLPPYFFSDCEAATEPDSIQEFCAQLGSRSEDFLFVLQCLSHAGNEARAAGRKALAEEAKRQGLVLSEPGVRTILVELEHLGAAKLSRGRGGSRITAVGRELLSALERSYG